MNEKKFMQSCQLCNTSYQMGLHVYDGKYISRYKMNVCNGCYTANWDGWNPHDEKIILEHLRKNEIDEPERNAKGVLPRD